MFMYLPNMIYVVKYIVILKLDNQLLWRTKIWYAWEWHYGDLQQMVLLPSFIKIGQHSKRIWGGTHTYIHHAWPLEAVFLSKNELKI